jgi:TolB-like protein/tRNA A-37 threonylcarbamoyl transferase component Bud32
MSLASGTLLGPYEVIRLLGAGGMGEVYHTRDSRLDRTVAVKVLRSGLAADASHRQRFLREVRATAAFNHPGIAAFYDAGESGDLLYLAMEYVPGHTLQTELIRGPIPSRSLADYSLQIATALEHAHARGVIHRDIKPANIMVAEGGALKLLDFGLAQNILLRDETATALTAAGTFVGTLHYCAPEVLAGRAATVRSDIYNLGAMMYEMACGRLPFAGLEGPGLISAVLRGEAPPVRQRNPAVSERIGKVIARAMAIEPQERFQSAAELAAALRTMDESPGNAAVMLERAMPVIAVLDFRNLSGDPATDWLGTGLAETVTTDLRRQNAVRVVSRERVQQELRRLANNKDMGAIAGHLNARWLVTGSYQRSGDRVRITPNLLEPATGDVAVTRKIDGAWDDIFDLQDQVVNELMRALKVELDSSARERIAAPETLRLEAYEQYAQGRKNFSMLGKDSLESARRHFEMAIELDSDYAVAYSALGQTYAMRWIHRNDPDDLTRASGCLERALELDPELGEPYATLCYVYTRQNKLEEAIQAGTKAIQRSPDAYMSHYFLGFASWIAGHEISDTFFQCAVEHFLNSIQIESALSPSWLHVGTLAMHTGAYDRAEPLAFQALELQNSNRAISHLPFVEMILAGISMRRQNWAKALEWHERGLKYLATIDHMYRETAIAVNACGMADVHLRQGKTDQALADLHRAWRIVREFPRMMANNRTFTRTLAGMAAAYGAQGEIARAEQLLNEASSHLETVFSNPGGFIHGVATFELCHAVAVAHIRLNQLGPARDLLTKAVEKGWRDLPWLESDPELAPVRRDGSINALIERVAALPPLHFGTRLKAA